MKTLGVGPCQQGHINDDIPLTGETVQADDGGTWWRVAPEQCCGVCGQPLDWMYEAPIVLEMPAQTVEVRRQEKPR